VRRESGKSKGVVFTDAFSAASVFVVFVVFSILLLFSYASADNQSVLLRYDPPVGKVLNYKASSSIQMTVYGMEMFINQSMELEMSFPDTTSEEGRVVDVKVNKLSGSVMRGENTMDYEPPLKLEGKKITLIVSPKGEVVKVIPHGYIQGMKSLDDLKNVFSEFFPALPDSSIQVGSEWSESREEKSESESGTVTYKYKLKKVENYKGLPVVVLEGKVKMEGKQQTPKGAIEGEGKGKIKAKLATEGCYIAEYKYQLDMKGNLVGGTGGDEKSREIITSVYFRCKLKGKKK